MLSATSRMSSARPRSSSSWSSFSSSATRRAAPRIASAADAPSRRIRSLASSSSSGSSAIAACAEKISASASCPPRLICSPSASDALAAAAAATRRRSTSASSSPVFARARPATSRRSMRNQRPRATPTDAGRPRRRRGCAASPTALSGVTLGMLRSVPPRAGREGAAIDPPRGAPARPSGRPRSRPSSTFCAIAATDHATAVATASAPPPAAR